MRKALLYIVIAFAAIGCTKDADVDQSVGTALTITSNIATRAEKTAWESGNSIGVYVTASVFGDNAENEVFTADGSGNFTSTDPIYLPLSSTVLAYYPYSNDTSFDPTEYVIKSTDQYDLLSAKEDNVAGNSSTVDMTFYHRLSKFSLTIKSGDGVTMDDLDGLTVKLSGIYTEATFNLNSNEATTTGSISDLELIPIITKESDKVTAVSSSAIIIPQELTDNATLYFTTTNYGTFDAAITTAEFTTGDKFTYTVTINCDKVVVSEANIESWNKSNVSGTADIVDIEYKKSDKKYYINSAAGLKAFADLVNGIVNSTAIYAGFEDDTINGDTTTGVAFGTNYTEIEGVLTRNIDLSDICGANIGVDGSGTSWTPIGKLSACKFAGTFDGGGYTVSGLYISGNSKLGLFGYLDTDGLVYNVGVSGSITTTSEESAGIVSYNYGWVMNSYSEVTLNGGINTAGIAGYNIGNVVNCYNRGDVKGTNNVGGIVGQNAAGGYVGYSFSVGDVSGTTRVGGVVGWNHTTTATAPTIKGCFCLDNTDYSIGLLAFVASSGSYTGNMYDRDYLTSEVFAILMNNGAYTYNYYNVYTDTDGNQVHDKSPVDACVWVNNSTSDYPTLDVSDTTPEKNDKVYDIIYNSGIYEIYTAAGLQVFANLVNNKGIDEDDGFVTSGNFDSYFAETTSARSSINGQLMNDINLSAICSESSSTSWTPIGTSENAPYSGTFNGNGKLVSNLYVSNELYAGLFGYTASTAKVSNLGVSGQLSGNGVGDKSDSSNGAVVGRNKGGVITNCYAIINNSESYSDSNSVYTAGVVGYNTGTIANCFSSGNVVGSSTGVTGGVVGTNYGPITNCYSSAKVSVGKDGWLGGVAGYNDSSGTITSCYWDSTVTGTAATKGVGEDKNSGSTTVTDYNGTDKTMKDAAFVTLLNSNAYTYNSTLSADATTACAWEAVTNSYPTLDFGADPGTTYSELAYFKEDSYPAGNVWYITDTDADETANEASEFEGLEKALKSANTSGNITVIFSKLVTLPASAFENCTYLTSISLPSATTIGASAFSGCSALDSVTLPCATTIGASAFSSCSSLISIELPSATEIGASAFEKCSALTELDLGSSGSGISSIGADAFKKDTDTTISGDIDLTIKVASESSVSVGEDGITLTYNSGSTAIFQSITEIVNWTLENGD